MNLLEFSDVSFRYNGEKQQALTNISFSINEGEFVLLCGLSASGKSTLLKLIKPELQTNGEITGKVFFRGKEVVSSPNQDIGFIPQDPDSGICMNTVAEELAFIIENNCDDKDLIRSSVAECADYFSLSNLTERKCRTLSGGEKQLLSLASAMTVMPSLLLLDEPTSRLDPVAADRLCDMLIRLNREFGITVIIAEHNTEKLFSIASRVIILDSGSITADSTPKIIAADRRLAKAAKDFLPSATAVAYKNGAPTLPLYFTECADYFARNITYCPKIPEKAVSVNDTVLRAYDIAFRYTKNGADIIKGMDISFERYGHTALVGANGCGKSTLTKLLCGLYPPRRGKVLYEGKTLRTTSPDIVMLPQSPISVFCGETVGEMFGKEELSVLDGYSIDTAILKTLANKHPADLSGGELGLCAFLLAASKNPKILIMDEPTKGMDKLISRKITESVNRLKARMCIITVTHDMAFAAECTDRCVLLFDGKTVVDLPTRDFLLKNKFYTTHLRTVTRRLPYSILTQNDIVFGTGADND